MREVVMGLAATATLGGGGLWYSGALEGGEFYPVAPAEVAHQLAVMKMPDELQSALDGNDLVRLKTMRSGNEEVRWDVILNGQPVARFVAELIPADGGTKVRVDFELSESRMGEAAGKHTPLSTPLVQAMAEIALAEQVDATLEKRPFNSERVANAAALHIATHPGQTMEYGMKMQAMLESADPELQEQVRAAIEANPPALDHEPREYGDGYATETTDWVAANDPYEASRPLDDN
jgi:hypothetical protein